MNNSVLIEFQKMKMLFTQNSVTIMPNSKNPLSIPITKSELEGFVKERRYEDIYLNNKAVKGLNKLLTTAPINAELEDKIVPRKDNQPSLHFQFISEPIYIKIEGCLNLSTQEYAFFIQNLYINLENKTSTNIPKYSIESSVLYIPGKKLIAINISVLKAAINFYLKFKKEIEKNLPSMLLDEIQDIIYDVMD